MNPSTTQIPQMGAAEHDVASLADRSLKWTLLVNLILPGFLFGAVYLLRAAGILPTDPLVNDETLRLLFYVLLLVAVSELGAAILVKKAIFDSRKVGPAIGTSEAFSKLVLSGVVTLAALGACPMLYGTVYFILGGPLAHVGLFAIATLLHFRLFRPNADFLDGLIRREQSRA